MNRRGFCKNTLLLSVSTGLPQIDYRQFSTTEQIPHKSYWAHQNLEVLGNWNPRSIEGQIPYDIKGSLYRFGPGSKITFGEKLNHFFDGDGFVTRFEFSKGSVSIKSEFVQTEARLMESKEKKMLFLEFGTKPKGKIKGFKNSPNISGILWQEQLLVMSESAAPYSLDLENLNTIGVERFNNSLPKNLGFSAHSRIDNNTGDLISFGFTQELVPKFQIYRISRNNNKSSSIHSIKLGGFYPIHDMALTDENAIFLIPAIKVNLMGAAFGQKPISDLIEKDQKKSLQILITDLKGQKSPLLLNTGLPNMNFHHIKAWQEDSILFLDSLLIENESIYNTFKNWSKANTSPSPHSQLVRIKVDLNQNKLIDITPMSPFVKSDFPILLENEKFISIAVSENSKDPLGFNQIILWNQYSLGVDKILQLPPNEILSEVVPCGNYLTHLGYNEQNKESFLDIRDTNNLNKICRIWLGNPHPIGFHGFFCKT